MKDASHGWMITRNFIAMTVMPTLMFFGLSHQVTAENPGICFMVTSSGKTINLGKICGVTIPENKVAQIPQQTPKKTKVAQNYITRIPIKRRIGRTPVIEVTFNNQQTFEMILDTGANDTLITRKMANKLKLKATGTMQAQIADGSQIQFPTGQVKSIAVGGVVANNLQVAIAPKGGIGLLGHDFFGNYDIRLREKVVEFHRR
jgi:predicted aspartyl protease